LSLGEKEFFLKELAGDEGSMARLHRSGGVGLFSRSTSKENKKEEVSSRFWILQVRAAIHLTAQTQ